MRWVTNKEQMDYMRVRQAQNRAKIGTIMAEEAAWMLIQASGLRWTRQVIWGCRLFDFWCHEKGAAIEIDGQSHDPEYDRARDTYNELRSAILVFRVPNMDNGALTSAIECVQALRPWAERRAAQGLNVNTRAGRRAALIKAGIKPAHGKWQPAPV